MSSVSRTDALLLSHPSVLGSYVGINNTDQLLPRIPKLPVMGDGYQVTAVATLGGAAFVTSGASVDVVATTYTSPARNRELRRIAAKAEVAGDIAQNLSMINDIFQQQIEAKSVSIWNTVGDKLINGLGTDPEPAGLEVFASENPLGVVDAGGVNLTFAHLHALIEGMRPWDGGQLRYFVMNRDMYSDLLTLANTAGFRLECKREPILNRPVLHYAGVPVLVTDWIPNDEGTANTSVYIVHLGTRESEAQFGGLVWCYNEDTGAGIRVDGPHRTSAATDLLYADLDLNIAFATQSTGAVYRVKNILPA